MRSVRVATLAVASAAVLAASWSTAAVSASAAAHHRGSFIGRFKHTKLVASAVPGNGDLNPYGVAVVRHNAGRLVRGDILVSNFNNSKNQQGRGSTIVEVSPSGSVTVFAHVVPSGLPGACPGGIGFSTALVIVNNWVVVGSVPSKNGLASTSSPGCLVVLNSSGRVKETISGHGINGPWDMTAVSGRGVAALFETNVLRGTAKAKGKVVFGGTVQRLILLFHGRRPPTLFSVTKIASGMFTQTNPVTFVVGPTGVGLGRNGALYIANTGRNKIVKIPHALTRRSSAGPGILVSQGGALNAPLGMAIAPNGDILTVNGADGRIVETTPGGVQVATMFLDKTGSPQGNGALFGLAVAPRGSGVYYVDDDTNTLRKLVR